MYYIWTIVDTISGEVDSRIQKIQSSIKQWLTTHVSDDAAPSVRIIYAGTEATENCVDLS